MKNLQCTPERIAGGIFFLITLLCLALTLIVELMPSLTSLLPDEQLFPLWMLYVVVPIIRRFFLPVCALRKPAEKRRNLTCARPLWYHFVYPTGVGGSPAAPSSALAMRYERHKRNYPKCRAHERYECLSDSGARESSLTAVAMDAPRSRGILKATLGTLLSFALIFGQFTFVAHELQHISETDHNDKICLACLSAAGVKHASSPNTLAITIEKPRSISSIAKRVRLCMPQRYHCVLPREPPAKSSV